MDRKSRTSINFPPELIIEIMSKLEKFDDFMNLMLTSKEIRELVFKTPKIMRKIRYNVHSNFDEFCEFARQRGSSIRNLKYDSYRTPPLTHDFVEHFLCQMPNLEDVFYNDIRKQDNSSKSSPELENLKNLHLSDGAVNIIKNLEKVKSLEWLSILDSNSKANPSLVANFVFQQRNLKELTLNGAQIISSVFSTGVQCKLKSLILYYIVTNEENLLNFLETQADSLEKFQYFHYLSFDLCTLIFQKFKKLKELIINTGYHAYDTPYPIYDDNNSKWKLDSLKVLQVRGAAPVHLKSICSKFPNLESLECETLKVHEGIYENLTSLEIRFFNCDFLHNEKYPKLKNFVCSLIRSEGSVGWKRFVNNFPNIENIHFKKVTSHEAENFLDIFKILKDLKNLKTFSVDLMLGIIRFPFNNSKRYNAKIDMHAKTVEISQQIHKMEEFKEIYNFVKENLGDFGFYISGFLLHGCEKSLFKI